MKQYLDILRQTQDDQVIWESSNASRLQYLIHNALLTAEHHDIEGFADLKSMWMVKSKKEKVIAKRRGVYKNPDAALRFDDVKDAFGVVAKLIQHNSVKQPIVFVNLQLSAPDLIKIKTYSENEGYIFDYSAETFTLIMKRG